MKSLKGIFTGVVLTAIASTAAFADTNIALAPGAGGSNSGVAIFGFNSGSTSTLGTPYDHSGSSTNINDGVVNGGNGDDTWPYGTGANGYVGATFTLSAGTQINSVVFYGRNFGDGGWFGTNNTGPLGAGSTLTAANLVVPTLQFTINGGTTWINDPYTATNNYVAQFTGAYAGGGAATNPATFTLTHPLTTYLGQPIDGVRLIGSMGGYAGGAPGGFLGADEFQVFAGPLTAPEPTTWALMIGGLAVLGICVRRRRAQV
jgi:hypothetical protein